MERILSCCSRLSILNACTPRNLSIVLGSALVSIPIAALTIFSLGETLRLPSFFPKHVDTIILPPIGVGFLTGMYIVSRKTNKLSSGSLIALNGSIAGLISFASERSSMEDSSIRIYSVIGAIAGSFGAFAIQPKEESNAPADISDVESRSQGDQLLATPSSGKKRNWRLIPSALSFSNALFLNLPKTTTLFGNIVIASVLTFLISFPIKFFADRKISQLNLNNLLNFSAINTVCVFWSTLACGSFAHSFT